MRRIILTLVLLGVLGGCQGIERSDEDRQIVREGDCKPRELEAGTCVPE